MKSQNTMKSWAIFSAIQNKIVIGGLTKKEAVVIRVRLMGHVEFSNDTLRLQQQTKRHIL